MDTGRLVGVAERHGGGQEITVGADGGLEVSGSHGGRPAGQLQAPELVVAHRQPRDSAARSAGGAMASRRSCSRDRLVPVPLVDGEIAQRAQRLGVMRPALQHVAVERASLVEPAAAPGLAARRIASRACGIVVRRARARRPLQPLGELTPERERTR